MNENSLCLITLNEQAISAYDQYYNSKIIEVPYEDAIELIRCWKRQGDCKEYKIITQQDYIYSRNEKIREFEKSGVLDELDKVKECIKIDDLLSPQQLREYKYNNEYNDNNLNGFPSIYHCTSETLYFSEMKEIFDKYISFFKNKLAFNQEQDLLDSIQQNVNRIMEALEFYNDGNKDKAKQNIKEILEEVINDSFFVSELDKSYAFRQVAPFKELHVTHISEDTYDEMMNAELSFFRARRSKVEEIRERKEMLHKPYTQAGIIEGQRFCCEGIPAFYLGTTSYVCWLELRQPDEKDFYVSSYKLDEEGKRLKILNLVIVEALINGIFNRSVDSEMVRRKELQLKMIKFWPLVAATSFKITTDNERKDKAEYIIPELIMRCIEELRIDGIAYLSKYLESDLQIEIGVNLAIPIKKKVLDEDGYGEICKHMFLTEPYNFKKFLEMDSRKSVNKPYVDDKYFEDIPRYVEKIIYKGKEERYRETDMAEFDSFLVSQKHIGIK
ncbi:hypothetical protein E4V42_07315 [Clostridium estertheticum]|uniref:RES domain-containing protein n=1 Tax=Clostridium estertheticum TaxID=238834 RepID=A0A5N7IZN3_9CLOT|nr:RES domain-containing protein [Clostridium estertheticum]MPQ31245.1 hypothetical protein [Clostridium estertheticum]MPQ61919.1 hypothetical protein [Clostridium estertheticum]